MTSFETIIEKINNEDHRAKYLSVIDWIKEEYPELLLAIKWSQPCFEKDGAFIISVTPFKAHMAVNLEKAGMKQFADTLDETDYSQTAMTFRIKWDQVVNYDLLKEMIDYQLEAKRDATTYWSND